MLLNKYSTPAERARGCTFSERFSNAIDIAKNGGTITGTLTYNDGGALFSGSQKVVYNTKLGIKTISFWITLTTTTQEIIKLTSSHSISVSAGTLAATGFASPTIRVNGVATTTITTAKSFVEIDTATAIDCNDIQVGYITGYGNFIMDDLKFWTAQLTTQEALDYFANATYTYVNKLQVHYPMTMEYHDPTNLKVLDASGRGNHATYVSGLVKKQCRGYQFSTAVSKYLTVPTTVNITSSATGFTLSFFLLLNTTAVLNQRVIWQKSATDGMKILKAGATTSLQAEMISGGSLTSQLATGAVGDGRPVNFTLVHDGTIQTWYVNGVQVSQDTAAAYGSTTNAMTIGAGDGVMVDGEMYDFKCSYENWTPLQILDNYLTTRKQLNMI